MMAGLVLLAGLAVAAFAFTFTLAALLLKLLIRLVLFPLFLLKWIVTGVVMVVVGPVLALVGILLALVFAFVLAVPLLPLIALGALVWLVVRGTRRPAVV
jgi:hypothetical protein